MDGCSGVAVAPGGYQCLGRSESREGGTSLSHLQALLLKEHDRAQEALTSARRAGLEAVTAARALEEDSASLRRRVAELSRQPGAAVAAPVPVQPTRPASNLSYQDDFMIPSCLDDLDIPDALGDPEEDDGPPLAPPTHNLRFVQTPDESALMPVLPGCAGMQERPVAAMPRLGSLDCGSGEASMGMVSVPTMLGPDTLSLRDDARDMAGMSFQVLSVWSSVQASSMTAAHKFVGKRKGDVVRTGHGVLRRLSSRVHSVGSIDPFQTQQANRELWSSMVLHPHSARRLMWDMIGLCLVFHDIVYIPLRFFDSSDNGFTLTMAWVTRLFWTLDLPASMQTGYVLPDGSVELQPKMAALHYCKSWFPMDVMIVLVDWVELVVSTLSFGGYAKVGRVSRAFRIIRLVRLLRLLRMLRVVRQVFEGLIQGEAVDIGMQVFKTIFLMVVMGHVVACLWYGLGASEGEEEGSWILLYNIETQPRGEQYALCLHWSLSQLTGGMGEVTPANLNERLFAIFVFIFGFLLAAVIVSTLTSSMTQLHMLGQSNVYETSMLRRYLKQYHISRGLTSRVLRNAQHGVWVRQHFTPEGDVELLKTLSEPLRMELHFELYSGVYAPHAFFNTCLHLCPQVMRKVCHTAMRMSLLSAGDVIFRLGERCTSMYFVGSGSMRYDDFHGITTKLEKGDWLSEAVLWTKWWHRGELVSLCNVRLCSLDAAKFQEFAGHFDGFDTQLCDYAANFVADLNTLEAEMTDLAQKGQEDNLDEVLWDRGVGGASVGVGTWFASELRTRPS